MLQQAIIHTKTLHSPHWQLLLEACLVRVRLSQNNTDAALQWVEHRHIQVTDKTSIAREYEHLTLVRLFIFQKSTEDAIRLLNRLEKDASRADRLGSLIEILLLLALAYQEEGKHVSAVESLEKALHLASTEDYVRIFLDEGESLFVLLSQYLKQYSNRSDVASSYAKQLLPLFIDYKGKENCESITAEAADAVSLTNREKEILRQIAGGYSNDDIARSLFLSVGTVKGYTYNLYQKLRVKNRVQAVSKALEMNLL